MTPNQKTAPLSDSQKAKDALRGRARVAREKACAEGGAAAGEALAKHLLHLVKPRSAGEIVAGYWPIGSEMDLRTAMRDMERLGHPLCLPAIVAPDSPLLFRAWGNGDPLHEAAFGTSEPDADAPALTPEIMLVPGLAFDAQGFRLGYGRGYYDRTIAGLRDAGGLLAIGIAYAAQLIEAVPREDHDQPLDLIVTENGIFVPGA